MQKDVRDTASVAYSMKELVSRFTPPARRPDRRGSAGAVSRRRFVYGPACRPVMNGNLGSPVGLLIVAGFLATGGWIVTRVVDSLTSGPVLAYSVERGQCRVKEGEDVHGVFVNVRNLSRTAKLNPKFIVRFEETITKAKFVHGRFKPVPPAYPTREPVKPSKGSVPFPIMGLQPNGEVRLEACYVGEATPTLVIADGSEAVLALKAGVLTWVAANEIAMLLGLLSAWLLTALALVVLQSRGVDGGSNED